MRGTPIFLTWDGCTPVSAGWAYASYPVQVPCQDGGGGYPQLEQDSMYMYLLRGEQYASWIHAGALS